jgi:hypothetical protein
MDISPMYAADGIVFPIRALGEERAPENAERYHVFQECAEESFGAEIYIKPHLVAPRIMEIVQTPAVLDAVESVIGPNIFLWSSNFFNKKAGSGKHVGFHQDSPYWGLDPTDGVVSAWIALTPSLKSSGCMQVVKGTHTYGILDHRKTYDPNSLLSVGQAVVYDYGPEDITGAELQPGEMSLHHLNLTHGGQPNAGENDRIGLLLRLVNAKPVRRRRRTHHFWCGEKKLTATSSMNLPRRRNSATTRLRSCAASSLTAQVDFVGGWWRNHSENENHEQLQETQKMVGS